MGHRPFSMFRGDYNFLRATVRELNNFIQYSNCQVVQLFWSNPLSIKAFTTIISMNTSFLLALGLRFLPQIHQNESNTFSKLFLLKGIFLWLQILSTPLNKGDFYETHSFLSAGSDSLYCSSNRQSELKVTHENTPNAPPRCKNVIFRHHYVIQIKQPLYWNLAKLSL